MKKIFVLLSIVVAGLMTLSSCKKDSLKIMPDPFYSYTVSGFTVQFKNESKFATSYKWDFGDGTTSTEASPTHEYPRKGKYVPTLTAIGADGTEADASTVLHLAKGSSVKLDDNTLSDWDTVTHNVVIAGKNAGNFLKAKYDYDGNYLYVYFEQIAKQSDGDIYDIYMDTDNNPATGFLSNDMPGGGYDMLLEGTVFGGWLDVDPFKGTDQSSFSFGNINANNYYTMGDVEQSGDTLRFEFGIVRSKIPGLSSTTGIKIAVQLSNNGWSTIGYSPDLGQNAFFLDMSE
ncbi:MAG: PKD domain-containing protein [Chitinophagaceae bacterium]|nr:MAG: PKD domain-containing protein [Chitinophagaceae bacterium]